jgi:hypothetical protein
LQVTRTPYLIIVSGAALLLGVVGIFDRRIKLTVLDDGIRYAQWGSAVIPWQEFSAYRWAAWRRNPYLQLVPLQSIRVLNSFSLLGKLNHRLAGMIGVPEFSIAVTPLAVSEAQLADGISKYLPETAERVGLSG